MKFNFDNLTNRMNTGSLKWDVAEGELPMWVADMDFETAPPVKRAIVRRAECGIFGYAVTPDKFFEAVADFRGRHCGKRPDPSHMVYSNGIVAAISSSVRRLTQPGENVLIQAPVFNIFYNSILNNGRNVISSDLVYEGGEYRIDFSDLEEKLKNPQTSLMILCNPHNPVGKIFTREELAEIGRLCKQYGVNVISDEIHCDIRASGAKPFVPFADASDTCRDISVTCISVSKTFNLAGLQTACLIIDNPVLRHKIWRGINTDEVGEPNAFAMDAAIAALTECDEWLSELNTYLFENRKIAEDYIDKNISRIKAVRGEATYLLWIDISSCSDNSAAFCEDLRSSTGLYLSDGIEYGECGSRFVRMNLATQRSRLYDGLERLKGFIEKAYGTK